MTNKQALREKFEAWAEEAGALPWGILEKHRNQDGSYPGPHYTYMWHAWSASHEALLDELEFLDKRNAELNSTLERWAVDRAQSASELDDAEKRIAELEARTKPAKGEVLVTVSGFTGCGKSVIAGEIEIAMRAIGVPTKWENGDAEKRMTGADWLTAIEMYKPSVRIVEINAPRDANCINEEG